MTIDPDVPPIARQFAGASLSFPRWLQGVIVAEGGGDHIIKAIDCSDPSVTTRQQAITEEARTLVHRMADFIMEYYAREFAEHLAQTWAPPDAPNDPTHLNLNFAKNLLGALGIPM